MTNLFEDDRYQNTVAELRDRIVDWAVFANPIPMYNDEAALQISGDHEARLKDGYAASAKKIRSSQDPGPAGQIVDVNDIRTYPIL